MATQSKKEASPMVQLRALEKALGGGALARGYVFRGDELWFRERGIELVVRAVTAAGQELCRHDGKDPEFALARLQDDLCTPSMFSGARCVLVRNADALLKKVDGKDSPFTRAALAFLGREGAGTLVVSGSAGALRSDGALARALVHAGGASVGCRRLYDSPSPWNPDPRKVELVLWLQDRAREKGLRLAPDDAVYLAAATGNELAALDTQLDKLRHGGGRGLRAIVGWDSGGTPWKAADELLSGDAARGLAALEALFRSGFRSDRDGKRETDSAALTAIVLAQLRSKGRQLLAGARALERGATIAEAAAAAGVPKSPMALADFTRKLPLHGAEGWRAVCEDAAALDRRTRTGAEVDAADFALLALRWRSSAKDAAPAPRGGAPRRGR